MTYVVHYVTVPPTSATGRLQLNENKTWLAWFGKCSRLNKPVSIERTVTVGASVIQPAAAVRDLG